MQTNPSHLNKPRDATGAVPRKPLLTRATALLDYAAADDCFSDAGLSATRLNAEEQLTRFLHWLQFTDRGHLPC